MIDSSEGDKILLDTQEKIIAYHGAAGNKPIDKFELGYGTYGPGIFFSDSIELAKSYTGGRPNSVYTCEITPHKKEIFDANGNDFYSLTIDSEDNKYIDDLLKIYRDKCDCLQVNNIREHALYIVTDYIVFDPSIIKIISVESLTEALTPELEADLDFYIEGEGGIKDEWYQYGEVDVDKWVEEATLNDESPELIEAVRNVCKQMNNGTYYDSDRAAEWMERYPHCYYNNEGDYGIDESLNEELKPIPKGTTIVELPRFSKIFKKLGFNDDDLQDLENYLFTYPPDASLGSGVYKFRWSPKRLGKGQSNGLRIIYIFIVNDSVYLYDVYRHNIKDNLTKREEEITRKNAKLLARRHK